MTSYFVSRHRGAITWARKRGIRAKRIQHLDVSILKRGDVVIGTLPIHLAAAVTSIGARYKHLEMNVPEKWRGKELTQRQMVACKAKLAEYQVLKVGKRGRM
jgi:CRISPR-associated protein Csx16